MQSPIISQIQIQKLLYHVNRIMLWVAQRVFDHS